MGNVFLSHSHEDKKFVNRLAADLMSAGVKVWLDEAEIKIGDSLILKIEEAISTVQYVAACLSLNSVKSNWVTKELDIAITKEIKGKHVVVLPLLLPGCREDEIPSFLSDKCYADFRNPDKYQSELRKLLLRIKPEAVLRSRYLFPTFDEKDVIIDVYRKNQLVDTANIPGMRNRVINYLLEAIYKHADPSERYWIYVALGEIGGKKAKSAIKKGLKDENEFARLGAEEAWKSITVSS